MSISPTDAQRSIQSSSRALYQNPSIDHGLLQSSELVGSPMSDTQIIGSVQVSGSEPIANMQIGTSGSMDPATRDSGGSSKEVTGIRTPDGRKNSNSHRQSHRTSSQFHSVGRGEISSQFRYDQVGSVQPNVELSGAFNPYNQPASGSTSFHGSAAHSAVRKNQTMNANHLLNFHYDSISRPRPRIPPPRRQQKIKPYNKDLFLQANYKFVVLDCRNHAIELMDPDKMLKWEYVIFVRYSTPFTVQCPICLESPLCPQITSCGHIFCFPCILRYLLMGEEDHKGDCWKKCPLCFMMVSAKDLYTIHVETVKRYHVGDHIEFTLLTRPKDSLIPSQKNQQGIDGITSDSVDLCDSFSKFSLTSDVELSVREANSELNGWLARAESGLVDDLEQLPYVCAALEQLEQRKKCWTELQALSSTPPLRNPATPNTNTKDSQYLNKPESRAFSSNANVAADSEKCGPGHTNAVGHNDKSKVLESSTSEKLDEDNPMVQSAAGVLDAFDGAGVLSSSYDECRYLQRHSNGSKHIKEKDSYTFYQAVDGQHLILHPLNMKCLLHYYGSYDLLPTRISGDILQLETVTQSEAMRKRYRFLSHLSLTTTFELCEIDLSETVPPNAMAPFMDEIKKRENQRMRLAKKELEEKVKAESAVTHAMPIPSNFAGSTYIDSTFSMDDFGALGSSPSSSTSPPVTGARKLFSDVTRLGFASGGDSPSLKAEESADASSNTEERGNPSVLSGQRSAVTLSFANIISTPKPSDGIEVTPKTNGLGKKGKKVLLSTAGGRRY